MKPPEPTSTMLSCYRLFTEQKLNTAQIARHLGLKEEDVSVYVSIVRQHRGEPEKNQKEAG